MPSDDRPIPRSLWSDGVPRMPAASMKHLKCSMRRYGAAVSLIGVLLGLYLPVMQRLAVVWWHDAYAFYALLVPLFSASLAWRQRRALQGIPCQPWRGGVVLAICAVVVLVIGQTWDELTLQVASMVLMIWGGLLIGWGWPWVRQLVFPLGFLALMLPFPPWAVSAITLPFQELAAWAGAHGLLALGIPVYREGLLLHLPMVTLRVAEACNGLKYLLTLVVFAVAFAYLSQPRPWQRVLLVVLAVPFALLTNAMRVIGTGVLGYTFDHEVITGMSHAYFGKTVYVIMLGIFVAAGLGLRRFSGSWRAGHGRGWVSARSH